ncbi:hypothetical protein OEZ60_05495 [Defluviimonas sp. WL0024]|uniref:Uncharacterized protein n=1 Tax=Albidovulum salinarum TaxID=2984153 RepID=A0ABT2X0K1_9RHOB|nr:hypothetical protein [Defluviimonas sp. WL0024]MCU9847454.1 hypothetical protein [Defluviimonas sp. WL0024]
MTLRLDPPRRLGGIVVAALCETGAHGWRLPGALGAAGAKRPVAIVICTKDGIVAVDPQGQPLALADLEAAFPALRDRLEAAMPQDGG